MRRKEREIKDTDELVKILSKTCVGTLSLSGGEYPYAVPLNFGFSEIDGKFKCISTVPERAKSLSF